MWGDTCASKACTRVWVQPPPPPHTHAVPVPVPETRSPIIQSVCMYLSLCLCLRRSVSVTMPVTSSMRSNKKMAEQLRKASLGFDEAVVIHYCLVLFDVIVCSSLVRALGFRGSLVWGLGYSDIAAAEPGRRRQETLHVSARRDAEHCRPLGRRDAAMRNA